MHTLSKIILTGFLCLLLGFGAGAALFSGVQLRSPVALQDCNENCLEPKELLGLLGSIGINNVGLPQQLIVKETPFTVVMNHPQPSAPIHYVFIPKRDIKDIADIGVEDQPYINDLFATMSQMIRDENLTDYRVLTNGPGYQDVAYLHFHLRAQLPK